MSLRNSIFWMHLVIGAAVGVVIFVIALTGTMLAFRPQIEDAFERRVRMVDVPKDAQRQSLNTLVTAAAEAKPDAKINSVTLKADPHASVMVNFGSEGALYVDPYSGKILWKRQGAHAFMDQVESWHRWLGMKKPVGHQIKGAVNIAFLVMIISGAYLWWPKSWNWPGIRNIVLFNPQATGKARDWNWHNVIGLWCAPVLIVISLTGLFMSYQWASGLAFKFVGARPPAAAERFSSVSLAQIQGIDLDAVFRTAGIQAPDWKTMALRFGKPNAPVTMMVQEKSSPYPTPRSVMKVDPATAQVLSWEPLAGQDKARRMQMFVRYLHTGEVYGILGQTIMLIGALGALVLVWTGLSMAWQRFIGSRRRTI
jgi:uncharacterized iron-regulated membrane protein